MPRHTGRNMEVAHEDSRGNVEKTVLALAPAPGSAGGDRHDPPAHITIHGPDAGNFQGLTTTTGWSLMLRIEVPDSVAILESPEEPTNAGWPAGSDRVRRSRRLHRHAALPDHHRRDAVSGLQRTGRIVHRIHDLALRQLRRGGLEHRELPGARPAGWTRSSRPVPSSTSRSCATRPAVSSPCPDHKPVLS